MSSIFTLSHFERACLDGQKIKLWCVFSDDGGPTWHYSAALSAFQDKLMYHFNTYGPNLPQDFASSIDPATRSLVRLIAQYYKQPLPEATHSARTRVKSEARIWVKIDTLPRIVETPLGERTTTGVVKEYLTQSEGIDARQSDVFFSETICPDNLPLTCLGTFRDPTGQMRWRI